MTALWIVFGLSVALLAGALVAHEWVLTAGRAGDAPKIRPVAFQFVRSDAALVTALRQVRDDGRRRLRRALFVDTFVIAGFIATFATLNLLAIELMDRAAGGSLQQQAVGLSALMIGVAVVAGLLDLVENGHTLRAVERVEREPDDATAAAELQGTAGRIRLAAGLKWCLLAVEVLWVLAVVTVAATHSPDHAWWVMVGVAGAAIVALAVVGAVRWVRRLVGRRDGRAPSGEATVADSAPRGG